MHRYLIPWLLGAALAGGCAGTYSTGAYVSTPDLVYVSPGVYAVANYSDPVFYANNYYWRYYDGYWYSSPYYTGGWRYDRTPPRVIARINQPYVRYYRDRDRVHVDRRYRPSYSRQPAEIRSHRARTVERGRSGGVRVIERRRN